MAHFQLITVHANGSFNIAAFTDYDQAHGAFDAAKDFPGVMFTQLCIPLTGPVLDWALNDESAKPVAMALVAARDPS